MDSFTKEDSDFNEKIILNEPYKTGKLFMNWEIKVYYSGESSYISLEKFSKSDLLKKYLNSYFYISSDNTVTLRPIFTTRSVVVKYDFDRYFIESVKSMDMYEMYSIRNGKSIDLTNDYQLYDFSEDFKNNKKYYFKGWKVKEEYRIEDSEKNGFYLDYKNCEYDEFLDIGGKKIKLFKSIKPDGIILKKYKEGYQFISNEIVFEPYLISKKTTLTIDELPFYNANTQKIKNIIFTNEDYAKYNLTKVNNDLFTYMDNKTMYYITHKETKFIFDDFRSSYENILNNLSKYNVEGLDLFDFSNIDLDVNIEYEFTNNAMWGS